MTGMVYLPNPNGLAALVEDVVSTADHLSVGTPPVETSDASSSAATTIDLRRLDPSRRT